MIVQRLKSWFLNVCTGASASLHRLLVGAREHEAVTAGHADTSPYGQGARANARAAVSWLDDGHRLRAPSAPREEAPPPPSVRPHLAQRAESEQPALPSLPLAEGELTSAATTPARRADSAPVATPDQTPPTVGDGSDVVFETVDGLDASQRRLVFLRYLVRQRVYNEGFSSQSVPEQYWRSLGRGDQTLNGEA